MDSADRLHLVCFKFKVSIWSGIHKKISFVGEEKKEEIHTFVLQKK